MSKGELAFVAWFPIVTLAPVNAPPIVFAIKNANAKNIIK